MNVADIQQALKDHGYDPGPIDGIRGRQTLKAILKFQSDKGLTVDGLVGPKTREALFGSPDEQRQDEFDIPMTMPWLQTAYDLVGTREIPGNASNATILGWAKRLDLDAYHDDDIPWCGLFVAHCVSSQLPDEILPANPLGARQWLKMGQKVTPRLGSVMVFWRGKRNGWKGHVGFYWAEDSETYHILGGNQSNSVSVTRIAKDRLLEARWPNTALELDSQVRIASVSGGLISVNEA